MRANQLGIELRHLVALDAVARHRSFHAAADELGYTQSAISQQIASLEQIVGRPLFERSRGPRPIDLTEAGRVLLGHAEAVLARVEAASADLTALVEGAVGELRVGTYQSVATRLLPVVLTRFKQRWPRIDVQLFESGSHDEIDGRVERGALDIAFTTPPIPNDELFAYTELLRDPYLLVVHPEHPLARAGRPPKLHALAEHDLIGYRVCRAHARVERHLREHGIEPRVVMRAEDNNLLQGLAAQGAGAAVMPLLAIDLGRTDTVVLDLRNQVPPREIGLLWHRGRHLGRPAQDFIDLASNAAAELAESTQTSSARPLASDRRAASPTASAARA